jgi:hypothetical protein
LRVAVGVVDLLEVIDVEDRQRQRLPAPRRGVDCPGEGTVEVPAVEQPRQTIPSGEEEQPLRAADDRDGQDRGDAEQDEPSRQIDRRIGT